MHASACGSPLRGLDLAGLERGVFLQGILLGADMSGVRPELMTKYLPTNFTDLLGAQQLADIKAEIANWTELVPDKGAKNAPDLFPPPITSTAWDTCSVPLRRSTSSVAYNLAAPEPGISCDQHRHIKPMAAKMVEQNNKL